MSQPDYCLGIDPGNSGAFALLHLSTRKIHTIWGMPLNNGRIHPEGVALIIDLASQIAAANLIAAVENVNSRPGQAHMWAFALGVGVIHGCLAALGVQMNLVAPQIWKSATGLRRLPTETQAQNKSRARELAARLFPESAAEFERVKDDGKAEACLIARAHASAKGWL